MRIPYTLVPYGTARLGRPCVQLSFRPRPTDYCQPALLDTGSVRTVIPRRELERADAPMGPLFERTDLCFGGMVERDVPIRLLDVTVASPDPTRWPDIELSEIPVACCETEDLPMLILGSSALTRLVILLREHDQVLHLKPYEQFASAAHLADGAF